MVHSIYAVASVTYLNNAYIFKANNLHFHWVPHTGSLYCAPFAMTVVLWRCDGLLVLCLLLAVIDSLSPLKLQRTRSTMLHGSSERNQVMDCKKSFKRAMQIEVWKAPKMEGTHSILCALESGCRDISRLMRRVLIDSLDGHNRASTSNVQGEEQRKLDIVANRIMKQALCCSGVIALVTSEEDTYPCTCSEIMHNSLFAGDYVAVIDPLDGSSNIDSGLPTGTIFGIYRNLEYGPTDSLATTMQQGKELIIAGYCLYSAATQLVVTVGSGVHMFTLDDVTGEFYLTRSNLRIPAVGSVYSFNDANADSWAPAALAFIRDFKAGSVISGLPVIKPSARYFGALVADVHNILLTGGIFGYPASSDRPNGKLRLLYEANPMAMIVEKAGGAASDGMQRILEVPVCNIHQRTPLYLGSCNIVNALSKYFRNDSMK